MKPETYFHNPEYSDLEIKVKPKKSLKARLGAGVLATIMAFFALAPAALGITAPYQKTQKEPALLAKTSNTIEAQYTKKKNDGTTYYMEGTGPDNDGGIKPLSPADNPLEYITIDGIVTGQPLQEHPFTTVIARYNSQNLDTAFTDATGYYLFQNLPVGLEERKTLIAEEKLFPNPYRESTNIDIYSNKGGNGELLIIGTDGKTVLQKNLQMQKGANRITLNGGRPGTYAILLKEENKIHTFKGVQISSNGPVNADVTQIDENLLNLKSTTSTDSITLIYSSPGFYTTDTTLAIQTYLNINKDIWQIPLATFDFKIKPYDINGNNISDLTLDFKWADETTTEHSVESDGLIHVFRQEYTNPTTTFATVTHNADTATYALAQFFRKTNHNLADTNYAQSPKQNSATPYEPTPLKVVGIPDTLELYMPHTQIPTPPPLIPTYGPTIRYDHPEVKHIMCSQDPGQSEKYIPVPSIGPTVIHWQPTWNEATGQQVPQSDLQIAREERDNVRMVFPLNNGKTLFPPDTAVVVTSTNDPMYILLQARNFSQSARTTYGGSDGNHPYWTTNNSPNGGPIINYSFSIYTASVRPKIFSECTGQYFNFNDPTSTTQILAEWVRDATTGLPTQFLYETGRTAYFVNPGTKF
jgi:hypothetical protein